MDLLYYDIKSKQKDKKSELRDKIRDRYNDTHVIGQW